MANRYLFLSVPFLLAAMLCQIGNAAEKEMGLKVGENIPAFKATDHSGAQRTLKDLSGAKGLLFVFFRSADW